MGPLVLSQEDLCVAIRAVVGAAHLTATCQTDPCDECPLRGRATMVGTAGVPGYTYREEVGIRADLVRAPLHEWREMDLGRRLGADADQMAWLAAYAVLGVLSPGIGRGARDVPA